MKMLKSLSRVVLKLVTREDESGQALVELAVSLPLFLVMLLGAAEIARLAYMAIKVSDAAKAAAQYGSMDGPSAIDTAGISRAAKLSAPYVFANCTSFSATALNPLACSCVTNGVPSPTTPTQAACSATCNSPSYQVQSLVVSTSASCNPLIHAPGLAAGAITLRGSAVQEVLN